MNLPSQLGQLLLVGFKGAEVNASSPIVRDIQNRNLGGVILFDRFLHERLADNNILSARQLEKLIANLKENAVTPLIVAVDQEGGLVNRFKAKRGFCETPSAGELGSVSTTEQTAAAAGNTAMLLAMLGINLNLAPVVDLDTYPANPIIGRYRRSFAADPDTVVAHARAWVQAHRCQGIKTCLKHFPGHGSSREDSHLGFVDIGQFWQEQELLPYRQMIKEGLADSIMAGHLFCSQLDPDFPATLSSRTIDHLLRTTLGYRGVVLSDDMQMRALTDHYSLKETVCRAIAAGIDLLVFGNNLDYDPDITNRVIAAMMEGIQEGLVTEQQIDRALRRVGEMKASMLPA